MRTFQFFAGGVRWKFNVFLAEDAGHFQVFWFAQSDAFLAMWAGDLLADILSGKFDFTAARRTQSL